MLLGQETFKNMAIVIFTGNEVNKVDFENIDEFASIKSRATFSPLSQILTWHIVELSRNSTFYSSF